jgi:hypothetical protein
LAKRDYTRARSLADRALEVYGAQETDPGDVAEARWLLARVLDKLSQDPAKARQLAQQAQETFRKIGPARATELEDITRFLAGKNAR